MDYVFQEQPMDIVDNGMENRFMEYSDSVIAKATTHSKGNFGVQ